MQPTRQTSTFVMFLLLISAVGSNSNALSSMPEVNYELVEHPKAGLMVGNVFRSMNLTEPVRSIRLNAVEQHWLQWFEIDRETGNLYTTSNAPKGLDREALCNRTTLNSPNCTISLLLSMNNNLLIKINLLIIDVNDHKPEFLSPDEQRFEVLESSQPQITRIRLQGAVDKDQMTGHNRLVYFLYPNLKPFQLQQDNNGNIFLILTDHLDYETTKEYSYNLTACDDVPSKHSVKYVVHCSHQTIQISILNTNDEPPLFAQKSYMAVIPETTPLKSVILQIKAADADAPPFNTVFYYLHSDHSSDQIPFHIDPQSGDVRLVSAVSGSALFSFKAVAMNTDDVDMSKLSWDEKMMDVSSVTIHVTDTNDHAPQLSLYHVDESTGETGLDIEGKQYSIATDSVYLTMPEDRRPNTLLAYFLVSDQDTSENAQTECDVVTTEISTRSTKFQTTSDFFTLNLVSQLPGQKFVYRLNLIRSLNAEELLCDDVERQNAPSRLACVIVFPIRCIDSGTPRLTGSITVHLRIVDVDEYAPEVSVIKVHSLIELERLSTEKGIVNYRVVLDENIIKRTAILHMRVIDKDAVSIPQFQLSKRSIFMDVNQTTGLVILNEPYDFETKTSDMVEIIVSESNQSNINMSVTVCFHIKIRDVNDNAPEFIYPPITTSNTQFKPVQFASSFKYDGIRIVRVEEEQPPERSLARVQAIDADSEQNARIIFELKEVRYYQTERNADPSRFKVRASNITHTSKIFLNKDGTIWTKTRLDREIEPVIDLLIEAHDLGRPSLSTYTCVRIELLDVNDHAPKWIFPSTEDYFVILTVNTVSAGSTITRVRATDLDESEMNGRIVYSLLSSEAKTTFNDSIGPGRLSRVVADNLFSIDSIRGEIRLKRDIDLIPNGFLDVWLQASDMGLQPATSLSKLVVYFSTQPGEVLTVEYMMQLYKIPANSLLSKIQHLRFMDQYKWLTDSTNQTSRQLHIAGFTDLTPPSSLFVMIFGITAGLLVLVLLICFSFCCCKRQIMRRHALHKTNQNGTLSSKYKGNDNINTSTIKDITQSPLYNGSTEIRLDRHQDAYMPLNSNKVPIGNCVYLSTSQYTSSAQNYRCSEESDLNTDCSLVDSSQTPLSDNVDTEKPLTLSSFTDCNNSTALRLLTVPPTCFPVTAACLSTNDGDNNMTQLLEFPRLITTIVPISCIQSDIIHATTQSRHNNEQYRDHHIGSQLIPLSTVQNSHTDMTCILHSLPVVSELRNVNGFSEGPV